MRPVPQIALDFISGAEGCRLSAYLDDAGYWTIGWGHRCGTNIGTISLDQAKSFRFADANAAAAKIATCVSATQIARLSEHQYSAIISFAFNLGFSTKVCPTMIRALNAGAFDAIPADFMLYDKEHKNGQVVEVEGLHNRRAAEVTLWKTADLDAAVAVAQAAPVAAPPSSYTREAETPPAPVFQKGLLASKQFLGTCALGIAGTCKAALGDPQSVQDAVKNAADNLGSSPLIAHSAILQHANGLLTVTVAVLAVAVPAVMLGKKFGIIT